MPRARSKNACHPTFSPEDADLAARKWRSCVAGRAVCTTRIASRNVIEKAGRLVLARMIGRPLAAGEECDHINRNQMDNRRENLRVADRRGNAQNRGAYGRSGVRGVQRTANGRFRAFAVLAGRKCHAGTFDTIEAAGAAAAAKRRELGFLGEN